MCTENPAVLCLDLVLKTLEKSGFYWGGITGIQAKALLQDKPTGTFLVRDSSNSRHLFTITLTTNSGISNVRIVLCDGRFLLDHKGSFATRFSEGSPRFGPSFDCVVKLVFYYMLVSRNHCHEREQETTTIAGEKQPSILIIWNPLYKEVSSLQHLCRRALNRQQIFHGVHGYKFPIPHHSQLYLAQYPYPI